MSRTLSFSRLARADLDEIFDFIAADNPRRALTYVEEIQEACAQLCDAPLIGMERSDLRPGIRVLPLWRRIVIAYELPPGRVRVLRVFSGGQDFEAMLSGRR